MLASGIDLKSWHRGDVLAITLAEAYARACKTAGLGEVVSYSVEGMQAKLRPGTVEDVLTPLRKTKGKGRFFQLGFRGDIDLTFTLHDPDQPGGDKTWECWATCAKAPSTTWLRRLAALVTAAVPIAGFEFASVSRSREVQHFVPAPPLARTNSVITCTEAEVRARYDDPAYFWTVWDDVKEVGDHRVCIRCLDAVDTYAWLGRTFEQTMELARLARPGLTIYEDPGVVLPELAAWWEPGDLDDELAGPRALDLVGYDRKRKIVEYSAVLGGDRHHVLIRELHELRALVQAGALADGSPVREVHVVFADAASARQERRPLLDVGVKVLHLAPSGKLVALTD